MSDDWPQGWYRGESPGTPSYGGRPGYSRPQEPGYRPSGGGAWPDQPPSRGGQYPGGGGGYPGRPYPGGSGGGERRFRFWGQPGRRGRRIVTIIATVIVILHVAVVGTYFWLNSKLNRSVT